MAAVLACGSGAVLSHASAAALWQLGAERGRLIHVTTSVAADRRQRDLRCHRRVTLAPEEAAAHRWIPATTPARTLLDIAPSMPRLQLEAAINAADKHDLITPPQLLGMLPRWKGLPGVVALRETLGRGVFVLTDSELERRFLPIAARAGLPRPRTQCRVNGFRVDFYWPDLGLVVETDGLRYHRTPIQQARDRLRDQRHTAAGLVVLRFTHAQVRFEPDHVERTLIAVARSQRRQLAKSSAPLGISAA